MRTNRALARLALIYGALAAAIAAPSVAHAASATLVVGGNHVPDDDPTTDGHADQHRL